MSKLQEIKEKISQQLLKGSELTCKQGNPINRVCVNSDCLSALTCSKNECSDCGGKTHKSCNYIQFHNFTQLLNEPIHLYGQFIEKVEAISRKHIDQFAQGMRQLADCFSQAELHQIKDREVRDIYSKQNKQGVRGEVTNQLYLKAKEISKQKSKMIKELIPRYSSCMNTITEQMSWMQKELHGCYDSLTDFPFSRDGVLFERYERQSIKPRREMSQTNLTLSSSVATMRLERESQVMEDNNNQRMSSFGLEEVSALLREYEISQPKDMLCEEKKVITRMCINKECQHSSLMCDDSECPKCIRENHGLCPSVSLWGITRMLKKRGSIHNQFVLGLSKIENSFIGELCESRRTLTQRHCFGDMKEECVKLADQIYRKKNTKCMKGAEAEEFYKEIMKGENKQENESVELREGFREEIKWMRQKILRLKDRYYNCFTSHTGVPKIEGISKTVEFREVVKGPPWYGFNNINNMISGFSSQQLQFLFCSLNNPKKLEMLFRASEHQFKVAAFHQHCDNIQDTLVIVRTEHGKTIGGFTHYKWNTTSGSIFDEGRKAFLLQMDLMQKMVHVADVKSHQMIYCDSSYGPIFGHGNDLLIGQDCNTTNSSHAKFPNSYNFDGPNKYTQNQESYKAFSGTTSGYNFKVQEYEVYRVVYQ